MSDKWSYIWWFYACKSLAMMNKFALLCSEGGTLLLCADYSQDNFMLLSQNLLGCLKVAGRQRVLQYLSNFILYFCALRRSIYVSLLCSTLMCRGGGDFLDCRLPCPQELHFHIPLQKGRVTWVR